MQLNKNDGVEIRRRQVNLAPVFRCPAGDRHKAQVEADLQAAIKLGLRGTPIFFFNGQKVEGVISGDIFELWGDMMIQ